MTDIHAPGGIQTHHLSRSAAADLRLRPCSNRDWHLPHIQGWKLCKPMSMKFLVTLHY